MTVTISPASPVVGTVSFVGTPTLTGNTASLGATITSTSNSFTISITGHDNLNVETLVVGGLKIAASATATKGAIVATVSDSAAGLIYGAFVSSTSTATGKVNGATSANTTSIDVAIDTGSCPFVSGTFTIGTESVTATTAGAVAGVYTLLITSPATGTTLAHPANEVVTESVANCSSTTLGSPGTVGGAITFDTPTAPTVFPGENFSPAGNLVLHTTDASTGTGYLAAAAVITAKIATAGVTFSVAPLATVYTQASWLANAATPSPRA